MRTENHGTVLPVTCRVDRDASSTQNPTGVSEPRNVVKREVGLGCHSQLDSSLIQFSTAGSPDSVTLFRTAVERGFRGAWTSYS